MRLRLRSSASVSPAAALFRTEPRMLAKRCFCAASVALCVDTHRVWAESRVLEVRHVGQIGGLMRHSYAVARDLVGT
jgi:hypothetical protein